MPARPLHRTANRHRAVYTRRAIVVAPAGPTEATLATMADVRALVALHGTTDDVRAAMADVATLTATHAYVCDLAGRPLMPRRTLTR